MCSTPVQLVLAGAAATLGATTGEPTAYAAGGLVLAAAAARGAVRRRLARPARLSGAVGGGPLAAGQGADVLDAAGRALQAPAQPDGGLRAGPPALGPAVQAVA